MFPFDSNLDSKWFQQILETDLNSKAHIEKLLYGLRRLYKLVEENPLEDGTTKLIEIANLGNQLITKLRHQHAGDLDKLRILSHSHHWMLRSLKALDKEKDASKAFKIAEQKQISPLVGSFQIQSNSSSG